MVENITRRKSYAVSELQFINKVTCWRLSNVINTCISLSLLSGTESQNTASEMALWLDT